MKTPTALKREPRSHSTSVSLPSQRVTPSLAVWIRIHQASHTHSHSSKELASSWQRNQNGPGYACYSCYVHFGTGRKVKAAADPKQTAITQFFKKQKQ
jgi:hypothetical protein